MASLKKLKEAVVAAQKKSPKKAAKSSMLSSEYVEGTDAEDDSTDSDSSVEITPKSTKAKDPPTLPIKGPNGSAQTKASSAALKAASITTSDRESDSESGSENAASSGSEDSSSDSPGESEEKGSDPGTTKSTGITGAKRKLTPERQPAKSQPSYKPPNGFEIIRSSSTVTSDMFSRSSLSGKQIWHITAPSSIPVDMIKEVSLESVAKGEAALSYKGIDYGFVVNAESSQTRKKILIAGAGSDYRLAPMEIAQTLQLQQLIKLPSLQLNQSQPSGSSQGSTTAYVPAKKAVRQQPEGLRMRFGPLGDPIEGSGRIGFDSSSDESQNGERIAEPEFRTPRGVEARGALVKRKHSEVNGSTMDGASSPASTRERQKGNRKKAKHDASHHTPRQPSSSIPEPSMDLDSPSDARSGPPAQSQSQETPSKRKETAQERKDRKTKEKRKAQKAKDHRRKDRKQDHKNAEIPSDHKQPKSIAT